MNQENHSTAAMFNSGLVEGGVKLASSAAKTWIAPVSDPLLLLLIFRNSDPDAGSDPSH